MLWVERVNVVAREDLSRSTFQSSNPIGQNITQLYAHMRRCPNNTLN